jgi:hypothetical protein
MAWDANGSPVEGHHHALSPRRATTSDLFVAYREALSQVMSGASLSKLDEAHEALKARVLEDRVPR